MDENNGIEDQIVIDSIKKDKFKFIIITRSAELYGIPYKNDQIYEFQKSGKYNINREKYKNKLLENREVGEKLNKNLENQMKWGLE